VIDLHFHDLRHEAISRFFEKGLNVPEVALISGHRDPRMLFRYTHPKPQAVVEKMRVFLRSDILFGLERCEESIMPSGVEGRESLTDQIMAGLERRFLQYGHRPSPAHWKGLRDCRND
jgi:Phage integrase family